MTRVKIVNNLETIHRHWRNRDVEGLAQAYAEDAIVASPIFGELRGRAEIAASFRELLKIFQGWTLDRDDLVIDGQRAVQMFHLQGMHSQPFFGIAPSWQPLSVHGVMFLEFAEGLVASESRVYDLSSMLMQLGVLRLRG